MAITIVNKSAHDIQVKVAIDGGDKDRGSDKWYPLAAKGGKDTWNRNENQVIFYVGRQEPGTDVKTVLGVVGATVEINA